MEALQLCRAANQPWRAASLAGGLFFDDPNLAEMSENYADAMTWSDANAPSGNRNRSMWLLTCFQIANEPSFGNYERAVYAALCGNSTNVLPVCSTWEDRLWAYYQSLVVRLTEEVW
jgi:nuclear pore complex protein Nup107